jgi:radical SAM-linked protein
MAIRDGLKGDGFKIGYHAPILSLLEGIVSRGDERSGRLVLDAYRRGARLDAWEEHVKIDLWREAIAAADWDVLGATCRTREPQEALPWAGIALGTSTSAIEDYRPVDQPAATERTGPPSPASHAASWVRVLFSFQKKGPPVFIAHLDLMTVFERALLRAGYAARFTEGFNPKPKLEFASPLGLGVESLEEIAAVDLHDFDSPERFVQRMNAALPPGLALQAAALVPEPAPSKNPLRRKSLMSLYWGSDFRVDGPAGDIRVMRMAATQPSIRATLTAEGSWESAMVTRLRTWAKGPLEAPASYFEVLGPAPAAGG